MRYVAICRFAPHEGPGYLATYLDRAGIPFRMILIDRGEPLPPVDSLAGLAMMGGPMSVNDALPWIASMLALVNASIDADVPVIGHCLGGQLLAKALGAQVTRNAVKEIGWGRVDIADDTHAQRWGVLDSFTGFHWHGETFSVPEGAVRVWSSAHCANQAFAYGIHFSMQCHIEMTRELIETWCDTGKDEIEKELARSPAVQNAREMSDRIDGKLASLHDVADRVYARWTRALKYG